MTFALALALVVAQVDARIEVPSTPVAFGAAFELAVVRDGPEAELAVFDERELAPLAVELVDVRRAERGGRLEERLVYRARAFALEPIELRVAGASARIDVASALPPDFDTAPEVPFGAIGPPRARWPLFAALAMVALAVAAWQATRRARAVPPPPPPTPAEPPPPDPVDVALADLARLGGATDDAGRAAEVAAAADRVRRLVEERLAVPALESTRRELLAALAVPREPHAALARLLGAADAVKFACARPSADARDRALADARAFAEALRQRAEVGA